MQRFTNGPEFDRFIARGMHHCGWLAGSDESARHDELCRHFMEVYGGDGTLMDRVIHLSDSMIDDVVRSCVEIDFPIQFSPQRADFVVKLIRAKRDAVIAAIGG